MFFAVFYSQNLLCLIQDDFGLQLEERAIVDELEAFKKQIIEWLNQEVFYPHLEERTTFIEEWQC